MTPTQKILRVIDDSLLLMARQDPHLSRIHRPKSKKRPLARKESITRTSAAPITDKEMGQGPSEQDKRGREGNTSQEHKQKAKPPSKEAQPLTQPLKEVTTPHSSKLSTTAIVPRSPQEKTPQGVPPQGETPQGIGSLPPLSPPPLPKETGLDAMISLVRLAAPSVTIMNSPPNDEKAKQVQDKWKNLSSHLPKVPLFVSPHVREHRRFLENLAKAIDSLLLPCQLVSITPYEKKKEWGQFIEHGEIECIIAPDIVLWNSPEALHFYKEYPKQPVKYFGNIPLLLLPDLSLYMKAPALKASLWENIQKILSPPKV